VCVPSPVRYDPVHYGVPEGSYSTAPDGPMRVMEYREMVQVQGGWGRGRGATGAGVGPGAGGRCGVWALTATPVDLLVTCVSLTPQGRRVYDGYDGGGTWHKVGGAGGPTQQPLLIKSVLLG